MGKITKLMTRFINQRVIAAIRAGVKPSIANPGVILETVRIRRALMTKVNNPKVRILIGNVKITKIGLITALAIPKIKATTSEVVKLSTRKPGTKVAVIRMAMAERIQLASALIIKISIPRA